MTIFDKSKKIHEQITSETWCQGLMFRRKDDEVVGACVVGWVAGVYLGQITDQFEKLDAAKRKLFGSTVSNQTFNDSPKTTFDMVLSVFREADL